MANAFRRVTLGTRSMSALQFTFPVAMLGDHEKTMRWKNVLAFISQSMRGGYQWLQERERRVARIARLV